MTQLKWILILLFIMQGLFHFAGFWKEILHQDKSFIKSKTLVTVPEDLKRWLGWTWMVVGLLFFISALLLLLNTNRGWCLFVSGCLLSQILILLYWPEARLGSFINLLILLMLLPLFMERRLTHQFNRDAQKMFSGSSGTQKEPISQESIKRLPYPVSKWLFLSGIDGKERIKQVYLEQKGAMKQSKKGKWIGLEARQVIRADSPGFRWTTRIQPFPLVYLNGEDVFNQGRGSMHIKLWSMIPVVNAEGEKTSQGAAVRYLAEMIWYPTAALENYIRWEEADSLSARAYFKTGGLEVSGLFRFNSKGEVASFDALRYYDSKGNFSMENWHVDVDKYEGRQGYLIPLRASITWKLKEGDFNWLKIEISRIDFNKPWQIGTKAGSRVSLNLR